MLPCIGNDIFSPAVINFIVSRVFLFAFLASLR
jgi:hypothetical protein